MAQPAQHTLDEEGAPGGGAGLIGMQHLPARFVHRYQLEVFAQLAHRCAWFLAARLVPQEYIDTLALERSLAVKWFREPGAAQYTYQEACVPRIWSGEGR